MDIIEASEDLIEIHDPEVDVIQIMADIRERIRRRREELGYDKRTFPTYGGTACPAPPNDLPIDSDLYHHLRLANQVYTLAETGPLLVPSSGTRLPLIGSIWQRVRVYLHNLALFYVNRAVAHQTSVNRHVISVLNQLTVANQAQQRAITALQAEIAYLRSAVGR